MTSPATIRVQKQSVSIVYMVAAASLFICCAWLVQATTFSGDSKVATVLWTLMAAAVAGFGAALTYVANRWLKAD